MAYKFFIAVLVLWVSLISIAKSQQIETVANPTASETPLEPDSKRLPPVEEFDKLDPASAVSEELPTPTEGESASEPLAPPRVRELPAGFGGPFARNGSPVGFTTVFDPSVSLDNQPGSFSHWGEEIRLAAPAWKSDAGMLLVTSSISADQFDTSAVFPTSGTEFPNSLWNIRLGTFYMRPLDNGWKFGAGINVGSE